MNLNTESWKRILYATVDGEVEKEKIYQLFMQAVNTAIENGLSSILVDGRLLSGDLSSDARFEFSVRAKEYCDQRMSYPPVAFVGHPPTFNGLAVATAEKLGLVFRLFPDVSEALEWLGEAPALHRQPR